MDYSSERTSPARVSSVHGACCTKSLVLLHHVLVLLTRLELAALDKPSALGPVRAEGDLELLQKVSAKHPTSQHSTSPVSS
jgi:hypothetical protein